LKFVGGSMAKYGRGLNREIVAAVNAGEIKEPFGIPEVKMLVSKRKWAIAETNINVTLANGSNDEHSPTNKKYFDYIDRGLYKLKDEYRGINWK
jgi:hypothetical protein